MLRDDRQSALDEVIVLCDRAADHYEHDAELLGGDALAGTFRALARERRALADELREHLRDLGDLPSVPDPEAEALEKLVERARTALSAEARVAMLDRRVASEAEIAQAIAAARATELPQEVDAALAGAADRVEAARDRLAQARARTAG